MFRFIGEIYHWLCCWYETCYHVTLLTPAHWRKWPLLCTRNLKEWFSSKMTLNVFSRDSLSFHMLTEKRNCGRKMELPFSQFSTKHYNFSWQHLLIIWGCAHEIGSDSTLLMSFDMTSQHSGGQTTVHTVSSVRDRLAHWHIPDTDASLMPLGWHGMLAGLFAKLLAGLRQVLAACRAGLVVVSTVCPFDPTLARLATNRGTSRAKPSPTHSRVWEDSWWDAQRVV